MKKIIVIATVLLVSSAIMRADDRPVTFAQLPAAVQNFINVNYPSDKISYATVDDDFIRPDYNVVLVSGVRLQFTNSGALERIESRAGVPDSFVPVQIKDYVKMYYPESFIIEYEVGKKRYEIKLSNRLELKFNRNFNLVEVDD